MPLKVLGEVRLVKIIAGNPVIVAVGNTHCDGCSRLCMQMLI